MTDDTKNPNNAPDTSEQSDEAADAPAEKPAAEAKPKAAAKPKADAKPKAKKPAADAKTPEEKAREQKKSASAGLVSAGPRREWNAKKAYNEGDLVTWRRVLYSAAAGSTGAEPHKDRAAWKALGAAATAKYLRFSAQKGRLVADTIRGLTVTNAAITLGYMPTALTGSVRGKEREPFDVRRAAAKEVFKVLKSAVNNAENNNGLSTDELFISAVLVDEGPTFKRWKPRARGRADRINKRTCHVTIVTELAPAELLEGRRNAGKRTTRAARVQASKTSQGSGRKPSADRSKRVAASKAAKENS